ncbi:MAG: hypothetical protein K1X75_17840 [Leptospirales bacterium]|nr:hypothetical protein [Leptospirales bacterium]
MSTEAQWRENARRLVRIAAAAADGASARRMLRALLEANPCLAEEAARVLDRPLWILQQLAVADRRTLCLSLEKQAAGALLADAADEAEHRDLRAILAESISENRLSEIVKHPAPASAAPFFEHFRKLYIRGELSFDPGLLFGQEFDCLPANPSQTPWRILSLESSLERGSAAALAVLGPPGQSVALCLQLGPTLLSSQIVTPGPDGLVACSLTAPDFEKLLPVDQRNRNMICFLTLRSLDRGAPGEALLANLPLPVAAAMADEDRPRLALVIDASREQNGRLAFEARVLEADHGMKLFQGSGRISLLCLKCCASLGQIAWSGGPLSGAETSFEGCSAHGPFLLHFHGEGSERSCSTLLPQRQPLPAPTENMLLLPESISSGKQFTVLLNVDRPGAALYCLELSRSGAMGQTILQQLQDGQLIPLTLEAGQRAGRFFTDLRPGGDAGAIVGVVPLLSGKRQLALRADLPGRYRLTVIHFETQGWRWAAADLQCRAALRLFLPHSILSGDQVQAQVIVPDGDSERVFDFFDQPVAPQQSADADGRRYEVLVDREHPGLKLEDASGNVSVLKTPCVDAFGPSAAWALAPVRPDRGPPEGWLPCDGEALLDCGAAIELAATELWKYSMACAEQASSRLFAFHVLRSRGSASIASADADEIAESLHRQLRLYMQRETGLFSLWDGAPANLAVTERVLRSLAPFRESPGAIGALYRDSLQLLQRNGTATPALASLEEKPRSASECFASFWERFWRSPEALTGELRRWLPALLADNAPEQSGFWSGTDRLAPLFVAAMLLPQSVIEVAAAARQPAQSGFMQRLRSWLGLAAPRGDDNSRRKRKVSNPMTQPAAFANRFFVQGGAHLFGATTGSVHLLQALLALERCGLHELRFCKLQSPLMRRLQTAAPLSGVRWRLPPQSLQRGRETIVGVSVSDPALRLNGLLEVAVPASCEIVPDSDGAPAAGGNLITIPLRNRQSATLRIRARLRGRARLAMRVSHMYNPLLHEIKEADLSTR